jgi:hypothetical protein
MPQMQLQAAHQGGEGEDQKGPAAVRSSLNLEKVLTAESIEMKCRGLGYLDFV